MRFGIDMLPLQSPGSRLRGVGRYGFDLVSTMLDRGEGHEFVLYAHDGLPVDRLPESPRAATRVLAMRESDRGPRDPLDRLSRENPDALDALLILHPFELVPGYDPPPNPPSGLKMAAIVYDFIPFLEQEHYLSDPGNARWFYRRLDLVRRYNRLLAISEATAADARRLLGLDPSRVVTVGGASDGDFFTPDRDAPMPRSARLTLGRLGIRRPFVFSVAGVDDRKNVDGLIDAFARLPARVRAAHQLVVTCHLKPEDAARFRLMGDDHGLGEDLVLTGEVPDEDLRTLYRRCAAFAFPSLYEGFGLPILEAMHCGAAVVAGNNSSQVEVVGDAGLLVNAKDRSEIARALAAILDDPDRRATLGARAIARAATFRWEDVADRTLASLAAPAAPIRRVAPPCRSAKERPRVAIVSPWMPKKSGISGYAAGLAEALSPSYRVDAFHDEGYVPEPALKVGGISALDARLLPRMARSRPYRAVLYQMGNSPYHGFMWELMRSHPGIVTLHDFSLGGFQYWRAHQEGDPAEAFRQELEFCEPTRWREIVAALPSYRAEVGGVQDALTRRGFHLNRGVFEWSGAVAVHSPWCRAKAAEIDPRWADITQVVPYGAKAQQIAHVDKLAARQRFGLPADALIFGCFGFLSRAKMNVETLQAFAAVRRDHPNALLLFVGKDFEGGEAARETDRLGLSDHVRFAGDAWDEGFESLVRTVDVGVSLRRAPTYGETSAALLDLLRHGVPTIVSDVGTFADYPDAMVRKVDWERDGLDDLIAAMRGFAGDQPRRELVGLAGLNYVRERHDWSIAAAHYVALIEAVAERRSARIPSRGVLAS